MIGLKDVLAAQRRIRSFLPPTPLELAPSLEQVWLKLEIVNPTHSFKVRGALNALSALNADERARGVVTVSSGNHAQGIAWATTMQPTRAVIVMSAHAAPRKIAGVRRFGIEPLLIDGDYDDAERAARALAHDEGLTYLSPYNHPLVAAGNGTVGLEIVEALPNVRRVIIPVGGGGLIGGSAAAIKALDPTIEVIGVNAAVSPDMYNYFYGESRPLSFATLADALPGAIEPESITLELTRCYVDRIVLVDEAAIAAALRWMVAAAGWLAEGGGVVGVAALLSGALTANVPTAVVISGANVDYAVVRGVLQG
ncbi:MAG: threonine/serine dehydratase [Chloroflexota bacterium]|nr:threonine/serine dehydratase [Chloroflexota bacterium]